MNFIQSISILSIAALLTLNACSNQSDLESIEIYNQYGQLEKFTRLKSDLSREGKYQRYAPGGVLLEEAFYQNDSLEGVRTLYFENGQPQYVEQYKNGNFDGPYKAFFDNGEVEVEGNYINDVMDGPWTTYYPTGGVKEVVTFANNLENGPFTEFYPNGVKKAEGNYLNGDREHGELKLYNEEGEHIKTMECDNGVCRTVWEKGEEVVPSANPPASLKHENDLRT